ncbi:retrovirus-related pol polyprotein from transposon TNT 1-94 [Tanacetum coccineum]
MEALYTPPLTTMNLITSKEVRNFRLQSLISISQLCDANYIIQFDDKQGTIFNANKEIVLIAPRRNDVYVLDMSSLTPNGACFFAKASESINWLWHKRLSHLNFKNINKLAKQNKVLSLPSLVYSKDKPCSACEKGKHHRASFKTKQNFSIRKCLHLLHMDLFGPVSPMSINHKKYTLVIVDEYSRYTWVYFLKKKSQAPEMIMSFIRMVENQNDVKVKQIGTDNGTEFRNHDLESFYDERGISQNFSFPYTLEQNGVAERKNRTLIEAARTMLNGSERIPDISYFHVFGCPVFIHDHKDHLGKFDAKADDGYFLGYSSVSKFTNTSVDEIGIDDSSRYPPVPDVPQSHMSNQVSTSSHHVSHDRWSREQHIKLVNIIRNPREVMLTRSIVAKLTVASASECLFTDFLFGIEPKKISKALKHPGWINVMHEELNQFYKNKVWTLVPLLNGKIAIGYSQEEGIDYDETFAPVARMEAIRIFLAFATYMNFIVYQMDVKSVFLNDKLKEEVYVKHPPSFESSEFPNYVCKLDKALYRLKQAPRACLMCKISVQSKRITSNCCEKNPQVPKRKNTSSACQILGGKLVCWSAKKQQSVAMSSAETEYVAAVGCCASILWMKSQLSDYDIHYKMVPIFCDNTSAIAISNNPVLHSRTKHIDIRYHFIRDHILKGYTELHFIPTEYQLADIFTKPLDKHTFTRLKAELGMLNID